MRQPTLFDSPYEQAVLDMIAELQELRRTATTDYERKELDLAIKSWQASLDPPPLQNALEMSKYSRFFSLFNQARKAGVLPYDSHSELLREASPRKVDSLRQLNHQELLHVERMIEELLDPKQASLQRMRRKVIGILAGRGATLNGKPDMARINAWCLKYGHGHCELNAYDAAGLQRLVTQAENIMDSDLKAIQSHA